MIFNKSFNLALTCSIRWYISLARSLVLIFYPLEKAKSLYTEVFYSSWELGKGAVTSQAGFLNLKQLNMRRTFMSIMIKCNMHVKFFHL